MQVCISRGDLEAVPVEAISNLPRKWGICDTSFRKVTPDDALIPNTCGCDSTGDVAQKLRRPLAGDAGQATMPKARSLKSSALGVAARGPKRRANCARQGRPQLILRNALARTRR